ncbi:MAG: alpha/beta hydrolase [Anaerolineae bacterium]
MATTSTTNEVTAASRTPVRKRGCLSIIGRGVKWTLIIAIALGLLGVGYQTIASARDREAYSPRGQLYNVNGHQMHLICMGEGAPTVILQGGASAESLWWYRVQHGLATSTRVCAYDRPGMGWSETVSGMRDGVTIASELHALLEVAQISPPYVMVGHSFGAVWARIYAAQYPDQVTGVVLVDSTFLQPERFGNQSEFDQWKLFWGGIQIPLWMATQTGVTRLSAPGDFAKAGYPAELLPELVALRAQNQVFDAYYAETIHAAAALREQAFAAKGLGSLPLMILWAGQSPSAIAQFSTLRDEMAAYSTDSMTRTIEGADHLSLLGNDTYAQQVITAILEVVEAAKTNTPLTK